MLILTENGLIAARDKLGRTPIVIGKKEGAYAASSESTSFPNLDYEIERFVGPGEILHITADGITQLREPNKQMQPRRLSMRISRSILRFRVTCLCARRLPRR